MKVVGCKGIVQRNKGKALLISIEKDAGKKGPELWPWVDEVTPFQCSQGDRTEALDEIPGYRVV